MQATAILNVCPALAALLGLVLAGDVSELSRAEVYSFHVISEVHNRYAKTLVTSRVANTANDSREVSFNAVLPENAFVSGFVIEMDGKTYESYVVGKEEGKEEYQVAMDIGQGAAHVQLSARDSNIVSVSVNVEAQKKVTFNFTYEELLPRELGLYNLRINLCPGQIVNDFLVEVHINETSNITTLEVPRLQENNEITDDEKSTSNLLTHIERPSPTTAVVRWAPTKGEQKELRAAGVKGQLLLRYDVNHIASPNQILVTDDGYFVHFYSPSDLPALPKYIVFVLDVSLSMDGQKISQLREAMLWILDELRSADNFTLITFSFAAEVWWPGYKSDDSLPFFARSSSVSNDRDAIVPATPENIAKAKNYVKGLHALSGSALHDALDTAMRVSEAADLASGTPLMIVLLTDGQPHGRPEDILRDFTSVNRERGAALFTLAFGEDADFNFLRGLALLNGGFGRRIYEAADAHLQLRKFYQEVSSPLLSRVNFTYWDGQVEEESLTNTKFPILFCGSELVVSGKVKPGSSLLEPVVLGAGEALTRSPAEKVHVSSEERLWAFLTMRQLLDLDTATPSQRIKNRAKAIAHKYSFVTPVTLLVVVKPNEASAVDIQRAGVGYGQWNLMGIGSAAQRLNISEVSWLDSLRSDDSVTLEVNGTARTYRLAINQTEPHLDACTTPRGDTGQCRYLANCVLPTFVDSLEHFLPYLCVVGSSFIGACCPTDTPPIVVG